ncbi:hypothetical protein QE152_g19047 [Popillia japonica]|uniref:Uncharacterized protein n=1 Tax=Popillia japonica TaxID=7064 RepID=A0AAW1L3K5_POPJA
MNVFHAKLENLKKEVLVNELSSVCSFTVRCQEEASCNPEFLSCNLESLFSVCSFTVRCQEEASCNPEFLSCNLESLFRNAESLFWNECVPC